MTAADAGELATLRSWLSDFRAGLERKTVDMDAEQLARRAVPPSSLSLLGLVRHLAQLEHHWFRRVLQQHPDEGQLFVVDGNWESQFDGAVADPAVVEEAFTTWQETCAQADAWLDGLPDEALGLVIDPDDRISTIRDVMVQVLQEYARHLGHADLLREAIDGRTGE
ncbi:MAG: DinB family protein [Ornithinibacter sp.]